MQKIETLKDVLSKLGIPYNNKAQNIIRQCDDWYSNKVTEFHKRMNVNGVIYTINSLNFAKSTSLQPFLNDPATEMLNVNTVISEFSKKDDYVVIWREHPLMKATILSMRPMYAEAYARFQRNFIEQDLGIMDRTHDYRIAFSVADVLYTDYSSLVTIWQQTGKEIHIL